MRRRIHQLALVGLGLVAGAVLQAAGAQVPTQPPPRDTVIRIPIPPQPDTIVRRDSGAREVGAPPPLEGRADSIQPLMARAELPRLVDAARWPLVWSRDSVLATGAITLADLLEQVPGLTTLRTGWIGSVSHGAYLGDVSRVRVFLDGLELDPDEPRGGRAFDLSRLPLWALDEVRVERTAGEVRVHARTWQVDRTTPYSRADVATGDQDTDLFRFYFGRRFGNGLGVQTAVQQFSTTPDRGAATNSETSILARLGWARRDWQADAFVLRQVPRRGVLYDADQRDSIPSLDLTRTEAYVRGGYGNVDGPVWLQVLAGGTGYRFTGVKAPRLPTDTSADTVTADTSRFQAQYAVTGGLARGPFRASATHRVRVLAGETFHTPSARVSGDWALLSASLTAEGRGADSIARSDALVRVTPVSMLRLGGAYSVRNAGGDDGGTTGDWRAEGAVRLFRLWIGGGIMSRDSTRLPAARSFGDRYIAAVAPAARGAFASVQGHLTKLIQVNLVGERWEAPAATTEPGSAPAHFHRPEYQTRADVFIRSNFLERFPTGNFGLLALLRHEYRSASYFPVEDGIARTDGHRIFTGLLEIRILDATLSYQFRNLLGTRFRTVPGYQMPRQTQFYGVRWTFWN